MAQIGEGLETIEVVKPTLPTPVELPASTPAVAPAIHSEPELVPV